MKYRVVRTGDCGYVVWLTDDLSEAEKILEKLYARWPRTDYALEHTECESDVSNETRVKTDTNPVYDYDAHPCSYELGGGWSCAPECDNPDHKL